MRNHTQLWDVGTWPVPAQVAFGLVMTTLALVAATIGLRSPHLPADAVMAPFVAPPTPHLKVSLWIGDSYTEGTGATSIDSAESCLTAQAVGWWCNLDAEGGTGFIADGHVNSTTYSPLAGRLAHDKANFPSVDVVVLDAGRNDLRVPEGRFRAAVSAYFLQLAATYPGVPVVVISPYFMTSKPGEYADQRRYLAEQAGRQGWSVVDPIASGWTQQWADLTSADHVHPDPAGHRAIAVRLTAAFRSVVALRSVVAPRSVVGASGGADQ